MIRRMVPQFRIMQKRIDGVNRVLREQITGIRVVRAFVREDHEGARFAEANAELTGTALAVGRLMALIFPIVMLILNVSTVAVLWFGAHRVDNGQMQIGALTAFLSYLMQILMSVMMATFMAMMIPRAAVSADRIGEVLDTESRSSRPPARSPIPATGTERRAARRRVPLPGRRAPVLQTSRSPPSPGRPPRSSAPPAPARRRCSRWSRGCSTSPAARCSSAASTSATSTPRTSGSRIGLVPAEALPVHRHGGHQPALRQPGRHRRRAVGGAADRPGRGLRRGHARRPGRADRPGRHQRLRRPAPAAGHRPGAGAKPEIYLFDDSFSALDLATDARLRAALRPVTRHAAVIVVAQRVSTIIDADQIVVLEDGAIVGQRDPRRAARDLPDVRRDRRVPAQRGGGGGMSRRCEDRGGEGGRGAARARRPTPPSGAARCSMGMPAEKSHELRPVGQAAARPARARAGCSLMPCWPLAVVSVVLAPSGPKILGRATDIIFAGVIGRQLPAGATQDRSSRQLRAQGNDTSPTCSPG